MRYYVIIPVGDINAAMINLGVATNIEDLRLNIKGTAAVLKFDSSNIVAQEVFKDYLWYTKKRIIKKLASEGWSNEQS
jgi:hypothetical protein